MIIKNIQMPQSDKAFGIKKENRLIIN